MSGKYTTSILFKIDAETLSELDKAASDLGHSRSLFIRDAIRRRLVGRDGSEKLKIARIAGLMHRDSDDGKDSRIALPPS